MKSLASRSRVSPFARPALLLAYLLVADFASALSLVPNTWTAASADGRYMFVCISPSTLEEEQKRLMDDETKRQRLKQLSQRPDLKPEDLASYTNAQTRESVTRLRGRYPVSGLYLNDGSTNLLWALPEYLLRPVVVANDGQHLVSFNDYGSRSDEGVLIFFAKGKTIRSYNRSDLITFPFLLPWKPGPTRPWRASYSLDENRGLLTVNTKLGDRFVFDLATGRQVSALRQSLLWAGLLVMVVIVSAALAARAIKRRRIRSKNP